MSWNGLAEAGYIGRFSVYLIVLFLSCVWVDVVLSSCLLVFLLRLVFLCVLVSSRLYTRYIYYRKIAFDH
jgi:hypothetical protein